MGKKNKNGSDTSVDDSELGFGESEETSPGLIDELHPEEDTSEKKDEDTLGEPSDSPSDLDDSETTEPEAAVAPSSNVNANLEGAQADYAPKVTDEKAQLAPSPHTPAELEPSQNSTPNVEPSPEAKEDRANADAAEAPEAPKSQEPESFTALHDDVTELAEHLGIETVDELKKAGDALTPAVSKLRGIESELHKLGDEAKARFVFAKTKVVEAMGALERLFKRG